MVTRITFAFRNPVPAAQLARPEIEKLPDLANMPTAPPAIFSICILNLTVAIRRQLLRQVQAARRYRERSKTTGMIVPRIG